MPEPDLIELFVRPLNQSQIRYLVSGSVASMLYALGTTPVSLAPPEYVIVRKLEYFREGGSEKHLRDIRGMLAISGDSIDRPALDDWIARRGLDAEWQQAST